MRNRILPALAVMFSIPALAAVWETQYAGRTGNFAAFAEPSGLLTGCHDVPEAVNLARELNLRSVNLKRYMESLAVKEAEISTANAALQDSLIKLKAGRDDFRSHSDSTDENVRADIDRMIALYDQMKPAEAAAILTNLPADFAAEILMRVRPEAGARIIASVEPRQAARLTTEMGARSIHRQ